MKSCFRCWAVSLVLSLLGGLPVSSQPIGELDSLAGILRQARADTTRLRLLLQLSAKARATDQDRALRYAQNALALSRQQADSAWQAQALLMLGEAQQHLGQHEEALHAYGQAQALSRRHNLLKWLARSHHQRGLAYIRLGRLTEAEAAFRRAVAAHQRLDNPLGQLRAYNNLSIIYQQQGRFKDALANRLRALSIAERHKGPQFRELHIIMLLNIGVLYNSQGEDHLALPYSREALRLLRASPNQELEAEVLTRLGSQLINLRQDSAAQHYVTRGLALVRHLGEKNVPSTTGYLYYVQTGIDLHRKEYAAAVKHARTSLFYRKALGDQTDITYSLLRLADAEQHLRHYAQSVAAATQAQQIARQMQAPNLLVMSYEQLADTHAAAGQYQQAFASQSRFQALNDSLFNTEKSQQLAELATRYQTEKKQAQIRLLERNAALQQRLRNLLAAGLLALAVLGGSTYHRYRRERRAHQQLQLKDAELERTQAELYQSLEEKEVLLKEVHHRVKNNLQVIASRLALQAGNKHLDPATQAVLRDGQNWVKSVALIHEMLYRSDDLASVAFQPFLEQLAEQVHRTFAGGGSRISWEVEARGISLGTEAAVPLGLVANELLSNAYKYAFAGGQGGHIRLELRAVPEGGYCLRVSDNGVGLPAGFRLGASSSLGLRLVQSLARRLEGRVEAVSLAPGTEFRFFFHDAPGLAAT